MLLLSVTTSIWKWLYLTLFSGVGFPKSERVNFENLIRITLQLVQEVLFWSKQSVHFLWLLYLYLSTLLEPMPPVKWRGTSWIGRRVNTDRQLLTRTPMANLDSSVHLTSMFWTVEGNPKAKRNPHMYKENIQTLHRKGQNWDSNPDLPFWLICSATMLSTGTVH